MKSPSMKKLLSALEGEQLIVASSTEPYSHYYEGSKIKVRTGTGGVVTALDPLLRASRGTWVSAGLGSADRAVVDEHDRVTVPERAAADDRFTLKRVWMNREEEADFLSGVSNSALWPLAHIAYVRPQFVDAQWKTYHQMNRKFAQAVAAEAPEGALVWINDYQLSLVGSYLRRMRPDLTLAFFWHIPWPAPQVFSICPWADELLRALMAHDVVGFNSPYHASHFMDTVDSLIEARLDRVSSTIYYQKRPTRVEGLPISVDFNRIRSEAARPPSPRAREMASAAGGGNRIFAIGVDRMDYTKGIPEKFKAVDYFLSHNPKYVGRFSLLQIASPTRVHLDPYQKLQKEVRELARQINFKYAAWNWRPQAILNDILHPTDRVPPKKGWQPITLIEDFVPREDIIHFYSKADLCLVTSLHDGMNLVCKEYVAARQDGNGALVLSRFAGAARDMRGARRVNPYSVEETAQAIADSITQRGAEERRRMDMLEREVSERDVYVWAAAFLNRIWRAKSHGR